MKPAKAKRAAGTPAVINVPVDLFDPSPFQTRTNWDLSDLLGSIDTNGFLGAILARPMGNRYEIVYGERRLRSCKELGYKTIPTIVEVLADEQAAAMTAAENLKRRDLDAFEESDTYARLQERFSYSLRKLAEVTGKSHTTIAASLKLKDTPDAARDAYRKSQADKLAYQFSKTHCELIARIPIKAAREEAAQISIKREMSTRELKEFIEGTYMRSLEGAKFPLDDPKYHGGACKVCPKMVANNRDLYGSTAKGNVCCDPGCFGKKTNEALVKISSSKNLRLFSQEAGREYTHWSEPKLDYNGRQRFVDLNERCPEDRRKRTWAELLAEATIDKGLLYNSRTDAAVEVADKRAAYRYVERTYSIKQKAASSSLGSNGHRKPTEQELEKRDEKRAKRLAYPEIAALVAERAVQLKAGVFDHWPFIWDMIRENEHYYRSAIEFCFRRREIKPNKKLSAFKALCAYADTLTNKEKAALLLEIRFLKSASDWVEYNQREMNETARLIVRTLDIDYQRMVKKHLSVIKERKRIRAEQNAAREARKQERLGKGITNIGRAKTTTLASVG